MKVRTEVDTTLAACGSWPVNIIDDIQTVRIEMGKRGFLGTPIFMVANLSIMSALSRDMYNSPTSYGQFIARNKLITDFYTIRFNEITLPKDSALFYTYSLDFSGFPEIELSVFSIEVTNIGIS